MSDYLMPEYKIPDDCLTRPMACLGRTGSGKSNTAKGMVERLLDARRRVVVVDPKGDWWGLRQSGDGKRPGYPIPIFGGDHADIEITEHAGAGLGR